MNYGGDAADQIVRYSLEGTEVALKLTGEAAKNFAVFAAAVLRDQKKMHGKTNLTRLLRENKPLRFFEVPESRMKEFAREGRRRDGRCFAQGHVCKVQKGAREVGLAALRGLTT